MIRKYHTLQNNACHSGEEPQNNNRHKDKGWTKHRAPTIQWGEH